MNCTQRRQHDKYKQTHVQTDVHTADPAHMAGWLAGCYCTLSSIEWEIILFTRLQFALDFLPISFVSLSYYISSFLTSSMALSILNETLHLFQLFFIAACVLNIYQSLEFVNFLFHHLLYSLLLFSHSCACVYPHTLKYLQFFSSIFFPRIQVRGCYCYFVPVALAFNSFCFQFRP